MALNCTALRRALTTLDEALVRAAATPDDDIVISAVIQRFEYSFELAWRMLKRALEQDSPTPAQVDRWSYRELLREGIERGYIDDFSAWLTFRSQRNLTSHTYNENKARSVFQTAQAFGPAAWTLLAELERRHGA